MPLDDEIKRYNEAITAYEKLPPGDERSQLTITLNCIRDLIVQVDAAISRGKSPEKLLERIERLYITK